MGRLKARNATSPLDQQFQKLLGDAERTLVKVVGVCQQATKSPNAHEVHRAREHMRTLQNLIRAVQSMGHLTPMIDLSDPDLMPEDQRAAMVREQKAKQTMSEQQIRQARQKQREKAKKPEVPPRRLLYGQGSRWAPARDGSN